MPPDPNEPGRVGAHASDETAAAARRALERNREFHAEYDKKGRQLPLRLAPGQSPALVEFYNVQCMGPEEALVTPMNARGPLVNTEFVMDTLQRNELEAYARAIGVVGHPPSPPPARVP